ncbi:MAG: hldE, partial [Nocardioides sp.]|nr:hldE [Nocardioides sp.]
MNPLVVLGDALLDVDVDGTASRLVPDAPVPVVDGAVEHPRPGGAALAACLAAADSRREVVLITALPDDEDADRLASLVAEAGVRLVRLTRSGSMTVKRRIRADGQAVVRLDSGTDGALESPDDGALDVLATAAAVLVSDYGRGLCDEPTVRTALTTAAQRCPVVWDPHPRGGEPVPGVRLVTPNRSEAGGGEGLAGITRAA